MSVLDKIHEIVQREEAAMIDFRRELHMHPELSMEEFETTKRVARELDKLGLEYRLMEPTGIVLDIEGAHPGKTVLLRADMDALPIYEMDRDLPYRSQEDGKMHACGHDAHTSMLLTAVKALLEIKEDLHGTVRILFQPSEENAQGAQLMVEQGAVEGVDNAFGIHIWTDTPSHVIQCPVGEMMAAADILQVRFTGQGGHGSRPDEAIDAAVMASQFVVGLQSVVSREISPLESAVVTIGTMEVGDRFNVIAQEAFLDGTVRTFNNEVREHTEEAIRRYAQAVADQFRGTVEVIYEYGTEPVINEANSVHHVHEVVRHLYGEEGIAAPGKTTGGEDFSYLYLANDIPGAFAFIGTRNTEAGSDYEHHHGLFNVDEATLKDGAYLYAGYAYEYLKNNA